MLRIISANLNGVRSAASKGFFDWMGKQDADFVCVQELKCAQDDMTPEFLAPHGYHGVFQHAVKKGYSGAGLYTRHKPDEVIVGFDNGEFDAEGRYVEARYGKLSVISILRDTPEKRAWNVIHSLPMSSWLVASKLTFSTISSFLTNSRGTLVLLSTKTAMYGVKPLSVHHS